MSVVLLSHHLKSEKLLHLDFKALVYTFMRLLNVFNEDIFTEKPPQLWHNAETWKCGESSSLKDLVKTICTSRDFFGVTSYCTP